MIISCPGCSSRFAVKDEAIGLTGRKVRCAKCRYEWFVQPTEESLAAISGAISSQQTQETAPIPEGSNLPAHVITYSTPLYMKLACVCGVIFFLFSLSIINSNKLMPHMKWYYKTIGIHDDLGIALQNVSAKKVEDAGSPELLVRGRILNKSTYEKPIPTLRITLLDNNDKKIRAVMLDSHDAALAAGEGIDFENRIANPPENLEKVIMDIGNLVNLAAR